MPGLPRPSVAIVADDLTGACDSAVGFARAGHRAHVIFAGGDETWPASDVLAIDVDSRRCGPEEAARRVRRRMLALRDVRLLIKKLDSTLRGNVRAELEAALAAAGRGAAIVAPAFPRYGRTTAGGVQLLDGVPVHEGFAGEDPVAPARASDIPAMLAGGGHPVATLRREELADGERIARLVAAGGFVVADAATDEDLDALVGAAPASELLLWAGSTGLSQAFGRALAGAAGRPAPAPAARRVVVAVGSLNPRARRQLDGLRAAFGVEPVWIGAGAPAAPGAGDRPVAILASPERSGRAPDAQAALEVARALGAAVLGEVQAGADGLVLTGGDTAFAAAGALEASGFAVHGEVEPGIPIGTLCGARRLPVVTKAGGFGSDEALTASVHALLGTAR